MKKRKKTKNWWMNHRLREVSFNRTKGGRKKKKNRHKKLKNSNKTCKFRSWTNKFRGIHVTRHRGHFVIIYYEVNSLGAYLYISLSQRFCTVFSLILN